MKLGGSPVPAVRLASVEPSMLITHDSAGRYGKEKQAMVPGDRLLIRAFHSDGQWYRAWPARRVFQSALGIVTDTPPGTEIVDRRQNWIQQHHIRAYYWFERPYNLLEVMDRQGVPIELYVHIASPAHRCAGELRFTDHELDVVLPAAAPPYIADADDFARAIDTYGYTPAFQAACHAACDRALRLVRRWMWGATPERALRVRDTDEPDDR
jgi:protein associated with RNAse G/E